MKLKTLQLQIERFIDEEKLFAAVESVECH